MPELYFLDGHGAPQGVQEPAKSSRAQDDLHLARYGDILTRINDFLLRRDYLIKAWRSTTPVMKVSSFKKAGSIAIVLVAWMLPTAEASCAITRCTTAAASVHSGKQQHAAGRPACIEEHSPSVDRKSAEAAKVAETLIAWLDEKAKWTLRSRPTIHCVPPAELRQRLFGLNPIEQKVEAIYSEEDHSIYLLDSWRSDDLRDRSILLHELVHHLQYLNHVKELCPGEFELEAFKFQVDWLSEHGIEYPVDLIGIDPREVLMLGSCDEMSF